jgi:hypothetical protein
MKKRLDVSIEEDRYNFIKGESERTGIAMNMIADELLAIGIAAKRGETIEQQSIPVIREAIQTELRKALAIQREHIREDMSLEFTNEFKATTRASDNRLAALLVRAIRDASIAKRLIYAVLSKLVSPSFAQETYEVAQERAGKELARKDDGLS